MNDTWPKWGFEIWPTWSFFGAFLGIEWLIWVLLTSKLVCVSTFMSIRGKTNLKSISNKLAKMPINGHKIGQMPLWHKNIKSGITWSFFVQFLYFFNAYFVKTNRMVTITKLYDI